MHDLESFLTHSGTSLSIVDAELTIDAAGQQFRLYGSGKTLNLTFGLSFSALRQLPELNALRAVAKQLITLCVQLGIVINILHGERLVAVCGSGVQADAIGHMLGLPALRMGGLGGVST